MTCTCSGHANEPNPCPACGVADDEWDRQRAKLDAGEYNEELGELCRCEERSNFALARLIDRFLESRLEAVIACPEEEA